ncbi:protein tyrosine phosphatase [Saccharibacter sp. 17.LH.SD]|uniref:tyrosine-protein phosphatase n=1 Tax=Saccharibacter sp. 17.LH.SD TaxID=2689393 RepID=UPI00136E7BBE|nr:tyrosine-protein phosphatase [Saccharibacter sp. 17.LH.SD]MXV45300.1 protein tyrosine phosphatase [Saccharibacter sp. 17.LH.SD]
MFKGSLTSSWQHCLAWYDSLFKDHAILRLQWSNLAPVLPGKIWRCNHPTPRRIKKWYKTLNLQSIINLRGHRACGSDALARHTCQSLNLPYIDMAFESRNAPHRDRILRFYAIYQTLRTPTLIHCKSGADRTGLASGLIILFEGGTARDALKQLHWRFLHFKQSRTGILDAFFLLYEQEAEGRIPFIVWVTNNYNEDALRERFRAKQHKN